jgi:acyl-CoA dehydrogenase
MVLLPLNVPTLRRKLISGHIFKLFKQQLPTMSKTEAEALEAGTVSFEGELFSGAPNLKGFMQTPLKSLSDEESAFLEGPVKTLCSMFNEWDVTHHYTDLPPKVWQYIKEQGFLGMIIPKEYGGLGFSASAQRAVLVSIFSKSVSAGTTICVPNSLGPAELLLKYGTEQQKNYYLPRLAKGVDIPCFALTNPNAGSDAAAIPDVGVVTKGLVDGKEVLGIKLNWDKRYITLSPVATVIGLAFRLFDEDGLLGQEKDLGITCALIPRDTKGVVIGRRHFPLNTAFLNGPTQGHDVFIPMEQVIGGEKMVGQGWRMLMECLSAGRAVSLPSTAVGGGHVASLATGAYARVRTQFNTAISNFEGIHEALSRIAGFSYIIDNALTVTTSIIDEGEKPSVLSAILKYHTTEIARQLSIDAMDVHGGKGICLGPNNYLGRGYQNAPISITVEGANILTRCLIIFGQGAIRCHPYVLKEMNSVKDNNLKEFDKAFFAHGGFIISNFVRSFVFALTNGYHFSNRREGELATYINAISKYSSQLAFLSDFCMIKFGASLKRREMISARLGDMLSYLYLASATIKCYHQNGRPSDERAAMEWACQTLFYKLETQLIELIENIGGPISRGFLKVLLLPFGRRCKKPSDHLSSKLSRQLTTDNAFRDRLTRFAYKENNELNPVGQLEMAFKKVLQAEPLERALSTLVKEGKISSLSVALQIEEALNKGLMDNAQVTILKEAEEARQAAIKVDDFSHKELTREGMEPASAREEKSAKKVAS